MPKRKRTITSISILLVLISFVIFFISARGCQSRSNKVKTGSSNTEWSGIVAPSSLTASAVSSSRIDLTWQDNSNNEDGFEIERSTDGINYALLPTLNVNTTTYSDVGLVPSTLYFYRVRASNTVGDKSAWSNVVSVITFSLPLQDLPSVWVQVAAGEGHTLAIASNGTVWAWGRNSAGQLGLSDTDAINRTAPSLIRSDIDWGIFENISSVRAGYVHSIALKTNGTIWSWGANDNGQLGLGDTDSSDAPTPIGSDSDWSSLTAGYFHTLVRKSNLTVWAWGRNDRGQLGLGYTLQWESGVSTPTQVGTDSDWSMINAGSLHTLGLKTDLTFWVWGNNQYGQLGLGYTDIQGVNTPTQVGTDSDWIKISGGGSHSISLKTSGTLWVCGDNSFGQLGDGTQTDRLTPRQLGTGSEWSAGISAGFRHTLGIKTNLTLWAWGNNTYGQLGLGDTTKQTNPILIGTLSDWSFPTAGYYHSLAIKTSGRLWVWGDNQYGQLGLGDVSNRNIPYPLGSPAPPSSLFAQVVSSSQINLSWLDNSINESGFRIERKISGTDYSLLATVGTDVTSYFDITAAGFAPSIYYYYRVMSFNDIGNSLYSNIVSTVVAGNWIEATAGGLHTLGIKANNPPTSEAGTLWAWGKNSNGQLGDGTTNNRFTPRQIGTDSDWLPQGVSSSGTNLSSHTAGYAHTLALKSNNTLWAWGYNSSGQLGDGTTDYRKTPRQIGSDSDWSSLFAGYAHTIGIKSNNTFWAWGDNDYGQLGLGDEGSGTERVTPTPQDGTSDWMIITAGYYHTLGLKINRTLWAWGWNNQGQLGDPNIVDSTFPNPIGADSDWSSLTAGRMHTLALKTSLTLWAWGYNGLGQLGDGTTNARNTPRQIGIDSDWINIEAGYYHTLALKTNGGLWAWGDNQYGQLGMGDTINSWEPFQIGTNTDWVKIRCGDYHSISLKTNNTLWVWGGNGFGQLGLGDTVNRNVPTLVGE